MAVFHSDREIGLALSDRPRDMDGVRARSSYGRAGVTVEESRRRNEKVLTTPHLIQKRTLIERIAIDETLENRVGPGRPPYPTNVRPITPLEHKHDESRRSNTGARRG